MNAQELKTLIQSYTYHFTTEIQLQDGIEHVFKAHNVPYIREKIIGLNRIDFVSLSIAIEIKIKGNLQNVIRQLHRYAQLPDFTEVILITSSNRHIIPPTLNNKTITVINIGLHRSL